MNKLRRKRVAEIMKEIQNIKGKLDKVLLEEEIAFDNTSENLQCSIRGQESEEAIEHMQEAVDSLENAISELGEI